MSCSHTESWTNLWKLDRDFSLRSQHLRPPELLSSPVKLSLSDPAPHIGEQLKRRETGGHTLTVWCSKYKIQFAISLLPLMIQKIRKLNLTDNAQQNTPGCRDIFLQKKVTQFTKFRQSVPWVSSSNKEDTEKQRKGGSTPANKISTTHVWQLV